MGINLALRFILEICALLSLGYWGFHLDLGLGLKIIVGIGAPLLAAVIWGTFGSPAAPISIKSWARLFLEIIIFGCAALALYAAGKTVWAIVFVSLAALNRVLMQMWDQA
ncbi:MAG: YrdB family protein [Tuberibacillus sp.]